jgi:coenzyme PQQ precursor peptide PqqA
MFRATTLNNDGGSVMSWKTPKIVEIALGAEINSYACAEARK